MDFEDIEASDTVGGCRCHHGASTAAATGDDDDLDWYTIL